MQIEQFKAQSSAQLMQQKHAADIQVAQAQQQAQAQEQAA